MIIALLGCSLALNIAFIVHATVFPEAESEKESRLESSATESSLVQAQMDTAAPVGDPAETEASLAAFGDGWKVTEAKVSHSLSRTFTQAVGSDGPALSAVFARLFVWDVDLRRDLLAGDRVEVLWRKDADDKVEIAAARLHTARHGKTLSAFRWQLPGDAHASYWAEDGTEAALRLENSPMNIYEQITALLKDRPTHAGMDFKADTGTPVVSPFDGKVTRINWHWRGNGNCVEVRYADGVMAKFLHLSEIQVKVGQTVSAGETLALSGNTGRSTAPHLHYQVERRGHVVDPVDYHGTSRRQLSSAAMKRFSREMTRLEGLMGGELAAR
jgi:murein DD-endopeptidase MepM/ murein hydrolase activator NlpD